MNPIIHLTAKRKETKLSDHDDLPPQTVTVLRQLPDEDDEERYLVATADGKTYPVFADQLHPQPDAPLTNVEFVTRMMEWGQGGAMLQAFILQAIETQARLTVEKTAEELDQPFIAGKAWRDCALEALGWLAARDQLRR